MATEFVCTIRATGGDYSTLSSCESANECDLTAATTKVFSHGGITGTIPDGSPVVGYTSGATGVATHVTATQILIVSISGTFQSGEKVYLGEAFDLGFDNGFESLSEYVTLSDAGDSAIFVMECFNDWPTGLTDICNVNGWTLDATNKVVIRCATGQQHDGTPGTGFWMKHATNFSGCIELESPHVDVIGIEASPTGNGSGRDGVLLGAGAICHIEECISKGADRGFRIGVTGTGYVYMKNSIAVDCAIGFMWQTTRWGYLWLYNATAVDCTDDGFAIDGNSGGTRKHLRNCLAKGSTTKDFDLNNTDLDVDYCASEDDTADDAGGSNNRIGQTFSFAGEGSDNFQLTSADQGARARGVNLSADSDLPFDDDIVYETRVSPWDIGAWKAQPLVGAGVFGRPFRQPFIDPFDPGV